MLYLTINGKATSEIKMKCKQSSTINFELNLNIYDEPKTNLNLKIEKLAYLNFKIFKLKCTWSYNIDPKPIIVPT
jgi:hypothetical protein